MSLIGSQFLHCISVPCLLVKTQYLLLLWQFVVCDQLQLLSLSQLMAPPLAEMVNTKLMDLSVLRPEVWVLEVKNFCSQALGLAAPGHVGAEERTTEWGL